MHTQNAGPIVVLILAVTTGLAIAQPRFREHVITTDLKSGYQVVAADLNGDGKPDLVVVDQGSAEVAWYENPGWQRHVIATAVPEPINLDCADVDGDGVPEIALLYRFDMVPAKSAGIVALLHHEGDVRQAWSMREIDRVPSAHRVRWARTDSSGAPVLIMAPLAGASAKPPQYDAPVPIYLYRSPAWKRELLSDELHGVLHGIAPVAWAGDRPQSLLTASFLGVRLFQLGPEAKWRSTQIGAGDSRPCPKCGSSDVALGRSGRKRFIAAIEPWHGNQVVVYVEEPGGWRRTVIDTSLEDGHALAVGDLDGDASDEIVAGFRGAAHRVYLYKADAGLSRWNRSIVDDGMAAASCAIRDLNGDGAPDVICIGASTRNLKWYENLHLEH